MFYMATQVERPRVRGIVGIALLRGILTIFLVSMNLDALNRMSNVPGWVLPSLYFALVLAVGSIVAALLIAFYKRWGLYLAVVTFGIDTLLTILFFVTGQTTASIGVLLGFGINLLVLYYVYRYLTQQPEAAAFT